MDDNNQNSTANNTSAPVDPVAQAGEPATTGDANPAPTEQPEAQSDVSAAPKCEKCGQGVEEGRCQGCSMETGVCTCIPASTEEGTGQTAPTV